MKKHIFLGSNIFRQSVYGDNHPLNIARVWPVIDICRAEGWLEEGLYHDIAPAPPHILSQFHDKAYIEALWQAEQRQTLSDEDKMRFNIGRSSNPIFKEVYSRPATAAHASLIGAQHLINGKADIIFNPAGGTHHGKKGQANGFCFVNDPAIALQELLDKTDKPITYLDIDAHHCDGVQEWHADAPNLQIISIHQSDLWPRTGHESDKGGGNACNFTLAPAAGDDDLQRLMDERVMPLIIKHRPAFLVLQAGADGHRDDPQSKLAYSLQGYWRAIATALSISVPTLLLGGGGYNPYVTARAWAGIWGLITGRQPDDITLCDGSKQILKGLSWHHRLGRNPPSHWFTHLGDPQ